MVEERIKLVGTWVLALLVLVIMAVAALLVISTISTNAVIAGSSLSQTIANESGFSNATGYTLTNASISGFSNPVILAAFNATSNAVVNVANFTVSSTGVVTNASVVTYSAARFQYSYNYDSLTRTSTNNIVGNTSNGITAFFAVMPTIFSVLAVAVLIGVIGLIIIVVSRLRARSDNYDSL